MKTRPENGPDVNWAKREQYWRRKLKRLRFGAEPLEEQLARHRRVSWALTAIPAGLGLFFFTLFAVFGRPGIGLTVVAVLMLPIVLGAWLDQWILMSRVQRYVQERSDHLRGGRFESGREQ
jgi:hypothetical protein